MTSPTPTDRFDLPLNWIRTGPEDASTVVFLHAVGYDLTYWDRQIEALRSRFRVVAFDLPGHGRSPGRSEDWSFDYAARIVARLLETVSDRPVHLVGLSVGGMIAQAAVLARPDLVRTLTLIGTASHFTEAARAGMRARAETVRRDGMQAVVASSLDRWFTQQTKEGRPDLIDRVTKTLLADDPAIHAAMWDMIATFDVQERLGEIGCPTLVLVGEHDPSTPPVVAAELAAGIANARLAVIPGASHIVTLEAPDAIHAQLASFFTGR